MKKYILCGLILFFHSSINAQVKEIEQNIYTYLNCDNVRYYYDSTAQDLSYISKTGTKVSLPLPAVTTDLGSPKLWLQVWITKKSDTTESHMEEHLQWLHPFHVKLQKKSNAYFISANGKELIKQPLVSEEEILLTKSNVFTLACLCVFIILLSSIMWGIFIAKPAHLEHDFGFYLLFITIASIVLANLFFHFDKIIIGLVMWVFSGLIVFFLLPNSKN